MRVVLVSYETSIFFWGTDWILSAGRQRVRLLSVTLTLYAVNSWRLDRQPLFHRHVFLQPLASKRSRGFAAGHDKALQFSVVFSSTNHTKRTPRNSPHVWTAVCGYKTHSGLRSSGTQERFSSSTQVQRFPDIKQWIPPLAAINSELLSKLFSFEMMLRYCKDLEKTHTIVWLAHFHILHNT